MTVKEIKALARVKLKGNWGNCISVTIAMLGLVLLLFFMYCAVYLSYKNITGAGLYEIYTVIKSDPLQTTAFFLGNMIFHIVWIMIGYTIIRQFIDISRGRDYNVSRNVIMRYKRHFFKISVVTHIVKLGIIALCTVPGFLAADAVKRLIEFSKTNSLSLVVLLFFMFSVFMIILSAILTLNSIISLHALGTIMLLNPLMPVTHGVSLCFRLSEGNKSKIVHFHLSFLKFIPLCLLVYPIVVIIPYYLMSNLMLVESIIKKELREDTFLDVFSPESQNDGKETI